jgi:hypothetical protein
VTIVTIITTTVPPLERYDQGGCEQRAEDALRRPDPAEANWPIGEQVEAIIDSALEQQT